MNCIRNIAARPREAGFSFVELMVVIVIIVIVATLALMQRGSANEQFQRQNVARELKVALERARFDSVKRRAVVGSPDLRAYVRVTSTGFELRTYKEQSGVWNLADDATYLAANGISIQPASGNLPQTIFFNQRGESFPATGDNRTFYICNGTCPDDASSFRDVLLVTPTGTVNLITGGEEPEELSGPTVTTVPSTDAINPYVVIPPAPTPAP